MQRPLSCNDLFCGAGGMGLGFKNAGFRLSGAWDFDKYACESYGNNVSPKVKQSDITLMNAMDLPYADVWTFGFPCQDLSYCGKRAGLEGERSGLFFEVMRLLQETDEISNVIEKPKIIMAENVLGLKDYLHVLKAEYLKAGYWMEVALYNSKWWNLPQNRQRYFVVGIRLDIFKALSSKGIYFDFPIEQHDFIPRLSSILEEDVEEKYFISDEKAKMILEQIGEYEKQKGQPQLVRLGGMYDIEGKRRQAGSIWDKDGIAPTLKTPSGGNSEPYIIVETIKVSQQATKFEGFTEISGTLLARDYKGFGNQDMDAVLVNRKRIRKLTPTEYKLLQGFPPSYKQVVSNTQFYKQMGNAVSVPIAQSVGEKIKEFLLMI